MTTVDQTASQMRWREVEDEAVVLPPREVLGPDEKGIKKVIEYKFNEHGNKVKVTTTTRVSTLAVTKLSKQAVDRRGWLKFGDAVTDHDDDDGLLTTVSTLPVYVEKSKQVEPIMVCMKCFLKGKHWSASCRGKFKPPSRIEWPNASYYAPPNLRTIIERRPGFEVRPRNVENSIRVSNLYDRARETDLIWMLGRIGRMRSAYVAIDQETDLSKGYGFITFEKKEAVERAVAEFNGKWYDNHKIRIEPWTMWETKISCGIFD